MSSRDRAERQSDAALCRRIAAAQGWTDLMLGPSGLLWGKPPNPDPDLITQLVPRYDTDPGSCLELLVALIDAGWIIMPARRSNSDAYFVGMTLHKTAWVHDDIYVDGEGAWFEQAFCRAAAAALEAGKES